MTKNEYSGRDNLEVMLEARNYNAYLVQLVLSCARPGDVVVDFGAGAGTFSKPLTNAGYKVICIETDPVLAGDLRMQGMTVFDSLELVDDASVDYIYSLNVLEHIEDDRAILSLWHRKLRHKGRITVYVPAFPSLYTSMDRKVGHVRRYTRRELVDKVIGAGFSVTQARYADSLGYFATLVYKHLGKDDGSVDPGMLRLYDRLAFPLSRAMDCVSHRIIGKNVFVTGARKDDVS